MADRKRSVKRRSPRAPHDRCGLLMDDEVVERGGLGIPDGVPPTLHHPETQPADPAG
jgi:hypothetical protein